MVETDPTTRADIREALAADAADPHEHVRKAVEAFMNANHENADLRTNCRGVELVWGDDRSFDYDEDFLVIRFRYWHANETDDPREPFLNRPAFTRLNTKGADGEWYNVEDLTLYPTDELYEKAKEAFGIEDEGPTPSESDTSLQDYV